MSAFRAGRIVLLTSVIFASIELHAHADNLKVGDPYASIQAAVDAALANSDPADTVLIPAGIYTESVSIITITGTDAQEKLTLKRNGSGTVLIRGLAAKSAVSIADSTGVTLKNLMVQSGTLNGGMIDDVAAIEVSGVAKNVTIEGCIGIAGDDVGVDVKGPATSGVLVKNSSFIGLTDVAFRLDGRNHLLENCVANGAQQNAVVLVETSENCRLKGLTALGIHGFDPDDIGYVTVRGNGHEIEACTVDGGGRHGFYVTGSGHRLSECDSDHNSVDGYRCEATDSRFEDCDAEGNTTGFSGGGDGVVVAGGKYNANSSHGLLVSESRTKVIAVTAQGSFGGSGVRVNGGVLYVQVRDCKLKNNGGSIGQAIQVDGDSCWIEKNVGSGGDGFVDGGTDNGGRGNVAKDGGPNDFP